MMWLKSAVKMRDGYNRIVSNLRQTNEASMKLHVKAGFQVTCLRETYYSNPTCDSPVLELIV
jgi:L-amino acid N-acyltransferase YncA